MTTAEHITENYRNMTEAGLWRQIQKLDKWNDISADIYIYLCDRLNLNYSNYDTPEQMRQDIEERLNLAPSTSRLFTVQEVAEALRVTKRTIYEYLLTGKLNAAKVGGRWRITQKNIDDFMSR